MEGVEGARRILGRAGLVEGVGVLVLALGRGGGRSVEGVSLIFSLTIVVVMAIVDGGCGGVKRCSVKCEGAVRC